MGYTKFSRPCWEKQTCNSCLAKNPIDRLFCRRSSRFWSSATEKNAVTEQWIELCKANLDTGLHATTNMSGLHWNQIQGNFWDFLHTFVKQCQYSTVYYQFLMDNVIPLLTGLSDSQVRVFHHTGTPVAIKIRTALVDVALIMSINLDNTSCQYEAERQKTLLQPSLYASEELKEKLELFTSKFKDCPVSMISGKEYEIAVQGVRLNISIQKCQREILSDEDCEHVYELVFSSHRTLAQASGDFLNEWLFKLDDSTSPALLSRRGKKRLPNAPLIRDSVQFFIESELQKHGAYLVDHLIDSNEMMKDWECMADSLLEDPGPCEESLDDLQQRSLIELMTSSIKQAATGEPLTGHVLIRKINTVNGAKQPQDDRVRLTEHYRQTLPLLLGKYIADPEKVANLLLIPQFFDINIYTTSRQEKSLESLLRLMQNIVERLTGREVLENCAKTLKVLCTEDHAIYSRCDIVKSTLIDRLVNKLSEDLNGHSILIAADDEPNEEELFSLESSLKKVATRATEMTRRIHTVHRWCVTGTPIQKSVYDLQRLLLFLNIPVDRYTFSDWNELVEVLAPIFWRTRKTAVTNQIQLPEQTEKIHWLSFSAVKQHFYQQQRVQCAQDAMDRFFKFSRNPKTKLSKIEPYKVKFLLSPLLRLRQACVHPQMVRGQFLTLRPQTKTLSMEELLVTLIKRAQLECKESQRLRVSAANGQAALHIIKKEWAQAAEKYRDVLRWSVHASKEFGRIRVVWRQLNDQASAVDELSMATLRLRLRLPHEVPQPMPTVRLMNVKSNNPKQAMPIYLLEKHDVDLQFAQLNGDLVASGHMLKRHMGHVLYLKNLESAGFGKTGNVNPDPCPDCQGQLGDKWSVLVCGHSFCMECIQLLVAKGQTKVMKNLKCAICRETTTLNEIAYVDAQVEENPESSPVRVKGSHSTKVRAVVQQLLSIKKDDPDAKCLLFSTWVDVLLIVGRALDENGISYCSLFSSSSQVQLNKFKRDPSVTVLLIPIQSGANGLNLTEATHVLLMEPILNLGSELQAIGRVHRIGQTKPTVVHRFLVKQTIEEKMALMLEKHRSALTSSSFSVKENPVTLADLKALFSNE